MKKTIYLSSAFILASFLGSVFVPSSLLAQQQPQPKMIMRDAPDKPLPPLSQDEKKLVITELAKTLKDFYLFPQIGRRYSDMLKGKMRSDAYKEINDRDGFGRAITRDLQAISPDGHLRVGPNSVFAPIMRAVQTGEAPMGRKPPLEEVKVMGDVIYFRFNLFTEEQKTLDKIKETLIANQNAKAIIFDIRPLMGGSLSVMDTIFPFIYDKQTTLLTMDSRKAVHDMMPQDPSPFMIKQNAPRGIVRFNHTAIPSAEHKGLQKVPVLVLTSNRTGSAGEHFALALKRTGRAQLIGETTIGMAHYGGEAPLGENFSAFIPGGRSYNPDDNWDWEGKGVSPNIAIGANEALETAIKILKDKNIKTD